MYRSTFHLLFLMIIIYVLLQILFRAQTNLESGKQYGSLEQSYVWELTEPTSFTIKPRSQSIESIGLYLTSQQPTPLNVNVSTETEEFQYVLDVSSESPLTLLSLPETFSSGNANIHITLSPERAVGIFLQDEPDKRIYATTASGLPTPPVMFLHSKDASHHLLSTVHMLVANYTDHWGVSMSVLVGLLLCCSFVILTKLYNLIIRDAL